MEKNPSWEANSFQSSQDIPNVLMNPHVHDLIHKISSPASFLSHINPIRALPDYLFETHFVKIKGKAEVLTKFRVGMRDSIRNTQERTVG